MSLCPSGLVLVKLWWAKLQKLQKERLTSVGESDQEAVRVCDHDGGGGGGA